MFFDQPSTSCGRPWYIRVSISRSAKAKCILRPRAVERLRQRQVLRHLVPHRLVGADRLVALARHQDELPVGDDVALAPRAVHPRG